MIIKRILVLSALFGLSFNLQAASSAEDCSAITDDAKRLKCYDTFLKKQAQQEKRSEQEVEKEVQKETQKDTVEKTITPTKKTEAPETELTAEEKFGSEQLKNPPKEDDDVNEIRSRAIGLYKMWEKGMEIKLENGQVWKITDYRSAYHMIENPEITIEKGLFNSYRLGIEGLNKRFRVKRIK